MPFRDVQLSEAKIDLAEKGSELLQLQVSHGLQLQSLWIIPTVAVS